MYKYKINDCLAAKDTKGRCSRIVILKALTILLVSDAEEKNTNAKSSYIFTANEIYCSNSVGFPTARHQGAVLKELWYLVLFVSEADKKAT